MGVRGKLGCIRIAGEPYQVFFGRDQNKALAIGMRAEALSLGACVAVMVGKASPLGDLHARVRKRGKEFLRIADAGECQDPAAAEGGQEGSHRAAIAPRISECCAFAHPPRSS